MKNIVLFGPPGSGKGTQANNIISKYHLIHLSTGDMLRAEAKAGTKLGLEAKAFSDRGELVPDAVVIGMIENKLNANPAAAGFVFDGFPRTVGQAAALDDLLAKKNIPIQKVLSLKVSEEELTKRILERGKTSGRADDQDPEIVKNRVVEYRTKTEPLANYYSAQGKLIEIQGEGTVEHISDMLYHEIDGINDLELALPPALAEKALPAAKAEKALPPAKKAAPAAKKAVKKAPAKKSAPKKAAKKAPKKAPVKKAGAKKAIKKAAPKKVVKKAAPKKVAKKAVKKAALKKVVKKAAPKKVVKKAAKKAAPKKKAVAKKVAPKKVVKKAVKKTAPKKAAKKTAPKKAIKKVASKKPVKKAAAKKTVAKKIVKKAAPKKVAKKGAVKKKR